MSFSIAARAQWFCFACAYLFWGCGGGGDGGPVQSVVPVTPAKTGGGGGGAAASGNAGSTAGTPAGSTVPEAGRGAAGATARGGAGAGGGAAGAAGTTAPMPGGPPCTQCWTYLGRDARSTYHNSNEQKLTAGNVSMLAEAWRFTMPGSATGTAAVVDGVVYAPSMGALVAFDAATGAMKWTARQSVSGSVTYDEGKLYVQNSAGFVVQLDAATGAPGWQAPVGSFGGFGTPLVVGNKVLVGASSGEENLVANNAMFRGRAIALDKATGQVLWQHYTAMPPANGAAIWSSPSADVELGMAFFTTGNNYTGVAGDESDSIIALDLETGALMWKFQATQNDVYTTVNFGPGPDHDFGTNPIVFDAGGKKFVGAGQKSGAFYALDRMTGVMAWKHVVSPGCGIGGIFNNGAFDGERILVSSWPCAGGATLKALDPATGSVLWQMPTPAQSWAPITVANGVGFVASQNVLLAFEAATGRMLHSYMASGSIASGAVVVDGRVYFGSGVPPLAGSFGNPMDDTTFRALALP